MLEAAGLQASTMEEAVTKIADYVRANKLNLQTIVEGGLLDEDLSYIIKDINRTASTVAQNDQPLPVQTVNFYEGMIVPDGNTIFVFGSNPEGRHGAGAAKTAHDMFGAQYGVGEGLTGNAYAIPTKDLRVKENKSLRSIPKEQIVQSIRGMYEVARMTPDKQFKVAYTNGLGETTLNGYTGEEMIEMFKEAGPIPSNVLFSRAWVSTGAFDQTIQQPEVKAPGTYDMPHDGNTLPQQPMEIWYGSSDNDPSRSNPDLSNLADRPFSTTLNGELDTPIEVKSVEHAFQLAKLYEMYDELDEDVFNSLE